MNHLLKNFADIILSKVKGDKNIYFVAGKKEYFHWKVV